MTITTSSAKKINSDCDMVFIYGAWPARDETICYTLLTVLIKAHPNYTTIVLTSVMYSMYPNPFDLPSLLRTNRTSLTTPTCRHKEISLATLIKEDYLLKDFF